MPVLRSVSFVALLAGSALAQVSPSPWSVGNVATLVPPPGTPPPALGLLHFGETIDSEGNVAVVGTRDDRVFVCSFDGTAWGVEQVLETTAYQTWYGQHGLAVSGDVIAVGAPGGTGGTLHLYRRAPGGAWEEDAVLAPPIASQVGGFGSAVDVQGELMLVGEGGGGADGRVHSYRNGPGGWTYESSFYPSAANSSSRFGEHVALDAPFAVVGDDRDKAYVFKRQGSAWVERAVLNDTYPIVEPFGTVVDISGPRVVVGASDGIHVYERQGTAWPETAVLAPVLGGELEDAVAIDGQVIVGGARTQGVYLFTHTGSDWRLEHVVQPGSLPPKMAVALDSAGTLLANTLATETGEVEVFAVAPVPVAYCTAGTSASGCRALLAASGAPSATDPSGFFVHATGVEGGSPGLYFYGSSGRKAAPWGNGSSYLCVSSPTHRGGLLAPSGTNGSCDGSFAQDLNARWCPTCPKPAHNPGAGTVEQLQLWYRDAASTSYLTTSLSDALEFVIGP